MKRYEYLCDAGSLRILVDDGIIHYYNNFGDGIFDVYICKKEEVPKMAQFQGQFIISKKGWLMHCDVDWDDKPKRYKLTKGIYSVYLDCETCDFYIYKLERGRCEN
jgi:hypothetical protein